ncbi:hypothetical protein SLE2022_403320 [Rubroshorea leprosula]
MAADGKCERIDGIEVVEKESNSTGTKKEGKRRLSVGSSQLLRKSKSMESLNCLNSNVGKGAMGLHGIGPKNDEGNDNNEAKVCDPNKENNHGGFDSELKSNGDLDFSSSQLMNQKTREHMETSTETGRDLVEEERITQSFWEGLASDNEILRSRAERLARDMKRKRMMEMRMKALVKARRNRRKKGRSQTNDLSNGTEPDRSQCPVLDVE